MNNDEAAALSERTKALESVLREIIESDRGMLEYEDLNTSLFFARQHSEAIAKAKGLLARPSEASAAIQGGEG